MASWRGRVIPRPAPRTSHALRRAGSWWPTRCARTDAARSAALVDAHAAARRIAAVDGAVVVVRAVARLLQALEGDRVAHAADALPGALRGRRAAAVGGAGRHHPAG